MKRAAALASPLWFLWGLLQWGFALSLVVFMRGFFPPAFESLLALRAPWAAACVLLTAAAGLPRAAAAGAAAAASVLLSPSDGGGGAAAFVAACAAWIPFALSVHAPAPDRATGAGGELCAATAAGASAWGAWALAARPSPDELASLALMLVPLSLAAGSAALVGPAPARLALGAAGAAWALARLLLAPLGLAGWAAAALALPAGAAGALALRGCAAAAEAAAARLPPPWPPRAAGLAAAAAAAATAAVALALEARPDWSHAAQGLLLTCGWALAWLLWRAAAPAAGLGEGRAALAAAAALASVLAAARAAPVPARSTDAALRALTRLADLGTPHDRFFSSLASRMGRPDRTPSAWENPLPPRVATPGKPDVFLLVVDSLRPDRLRRGSTPALDALAADSAVFERAFTPYGGTHLAVPALWAGTLLPHGPLPRPFSKLNALERLLVEEGYRRLVAPDVHVQAVTDGTPGWETFDHGNSILRRACPALDDLGRRLGPRRAGDPPVFAYAQLFDLHIAARDAGARDEASRPAPTGSYDRALAAADACVGAFLRRLKSLDRYERALIVVTADHGDSLGEEGRWGHAHTAFPEVLRIPLMLKLPKGSAQALAADTSGPALLTDVTPTLARLLGRAPWPDRPGAGRSLLRAPGDPDRPARDGFLVASSYAPVFGALSAAGDELFLADAVDRAFHLFALPPRGPAVRLDLAPERLAAETRRLKALLAGSARQ